MPANVSCVLPRSSFRSAPIPLSALEAPQAVGVEIPVGEESSHASLSRFGKLDVFFTAPQLSHRAQRIPRLRNGAGNRGAPEGGEEAGGDEGWLTYPVESMPYPDAEHTPCVPPTN